jgi:hypothetical protein
MHDIILTHSMGTLNTRPYTAALIAHTHNMNVHTRYVCVIINRSAAATGARALSLLIIYDVESNGRDYTPCRCSTVDACIRSPCSMVHVQFESVRKQTYKVIIIDIQYPMVLGRKRARYVSRCFW